MRAMMWAVGIVALAVVVSVIVVSLLPRERSATSIVEFDATPEEVFAVYSDPASQPVWRDGVASVEIERDAFPRTWVEQPKRGPSIRFKEVEMDAPHLYVLDLTSEGAFTGRYTARFEEVAEGRTHGTFTESAKLTSPFATLISYVFVNLDREMKTYAGEAQAEIARRRN